jgi:hypothetical protein
MQANYGIQSEMEEFVGIKASNTSTNKDLKFEWADDPAVEDFTVYGKSVEIESNSLHLRESFKAFTPYTIAPEH